MTDVAAAIVENDRGQVLLAQRPPGKHLAGYWEFPGGKLERGEPAEIAIRRELKEELEIEVEVTRSLGAFEYDYGASQVRLHVFVARALGEPRATADVHVFKWVDPKRIDSKMLAPADLKPLQVYLSDSGPRSK